MVLTAQLQMSAVNFVSERNEVFVRREDEDVLVLVFFLRRDIIGAWLLIISRFYRANGGQMRV